MNGKRWLWLAVAMVALAACGPQETVEPSPTEPAGEPPTEAATNPPPAPAAVEFKVVNKFGAPLCAVYAAPSDQSDYGDNLLSGELANGDSVKLALPEPGLYDFAATACDAPDTKADERIGNDISYGEIVWEVGKDVFVLQNAAPPLTGAAASGAAQGNSARPSASAQGANFDPQRDGFQFNNYTTEHVDHDLTVDSMRAIFGDPAACLVIIGGQCTPSIVAALWKDKLNAAIKNGHCEGFTVAAMRMFMGEIKPPTFDPSASSVYAIKGNGDIYSQISRDYVLQITSEVRSQAVMGTPTQVAQALAKLGQPVDVTIRTDAGGHSLVGYKVEDKGSGILWVWVYDNNWAGYYNYIVVDTNADTWAYSLAAQNPSEDSKAWTGNASTKSFFFTPYSAYTKFPFCLSCIPGKFAGGSAGGLEARPTLIDNSTMLVSMEGSGRMLITNDAGQRVGYVNGAYVNEVPGADVFRWSGVTVNRSEPMVFIPKGKIDVKVDPRTARGLNRGDVDMISDNFLFRATGLGLNGQQSSQLAISSQDRQVRLSPGGKSRPVLQLGIVADSGKQFLMTLAGGAFDEGQALDMGIDPDTGKMVFKAEGMGDDHFNFVMAAIDQNGSEIFANNDFALGGEAGAAFDYENWNGGPLEVDLDADGDGTYESSESLDDQPFTDLDDTIGSAGDFEDLLDGYFSYMGPDEVSEYFNSLEELGVPQDEIGQEYLDAQGDFTLTDEEQQTIDESVGSPTEEPALTEEPVDTSATEEAPPPDDATPADEPPPPLF